MMGADIDQVDQASTVLPDTIIDSRSAEATPHLNTTRSDEESALLPSQTVHLKRNSSTFGVISILLLGEYIGSADTVFMFTAGSKISSDFQSLESIRWLTTAYILAVCVSQPLVGKLSDIFGRKSILLSTYILFSLGCLICGFATSMVQVILGRVVSGIGGGGMMTMSSIIITDLVDKRDVAAWRAYINLAMTTGRSTGGPLAGFLTDSLGWRWLFHVQVLLLLLAAFVAAVWLQLPKSESINDENVTKSYLSKFKRIDFSGITFLAISILAGMALLEAGGKQFSWQSPVVVILASVSLVFGVLFFVTEAYYASEPVFALHLLKSSEVVFSYIIVLLQMAAQIGLMSSIPLYFQVTTRASATVAGLHLVPAVLGNAIGSVLTGITIKRTGRYKGMLMAAGPLAVLSYFLLLLRWNGNTGLWDSFIIFPAGFGTGIVQTAVFVSMTATINEADVAMVISGFSLMTSIGFIGGVTAANSVLDTIFTRCLQKGLENMDLDTEKITKRVLSDATYTTNLKGILRDIVVRCYVYGIHCTYFVSLACSSLASIASLFLKGYQL